MFRPSRSSKANPFLLKKYKKDDSGGAKNFYEFTSARILERDEIGFGHFESHEIQCLPLYSIIKALGEWWGGGEGLEGARSSLASNILYI